MRSGRSRMVLREGGYFRLVCVPFAGGSIRSFTRLARHATVQWTVVAVQPPPAHTGKLGLDDLAAFYLNLLRDDLGVPGILFGHSLGAAVVHRMAAMSATEWSAEVQLVLSAPPVSEAPPIGLSSLDDHALLAAARELSMLPDLPVTEDALIRFVIPDLRQDLGVIGATGWTPSPVSVPVHLFGGSSDRLSPPDRLPALRMALQARSLRLIDGSHMYVIDEPARTCEALDAICNTAPRYQDSSMGGER